MNQIVVLDESVSWPFTMPPGRSNCDGVPPGVADFASNFEPWHLIGWKDSSSNTIGIAREHQAITINHDEVELLSICFMRRAKGPGFISLEAKVEGNRNPIVLFEVTHFNDDALNWLHGKAPELEALYGLPVSVNDYGSDY